MSVEHVEGATPDPKYCIGHSQKLLAGEPDMRPARKFGHVEGSKCSRPNFGSKP
jgi:hypothetical protein